MLPKQFVISVSPMEVPMDWTQDILCGVVLNRSKYLPLIRIFSSNKLIGFVLGWFSYNDNFFYQDDQLSLESSIDAIFYSKLGGRFLIVEQRAGDIFIYSDPGAQLAIVYDKYARVVASAPVVMNYYKEREWDFEVATQVVRADGKTWYPFGLVPYHDLIRLLPGRKLNLASGEILCIDYLSPSSKESPVAEIVKDIFNDVTSNIQAISETGKLSAHLTAGYDSRMVLSSILKGGIDVSFNTIRHAFKGSQLDCEIATLLAKKNNLCHRILKYSAPDEIDIDEWLQRTSYCIKDAVTQLCKTIEKYDDGSFTISGNCGEVGRAFYWQEKDIGEQDISANELLSRLGFKTSDLLLDECNNWLNELPYPLKKTSILDRAYIDIRLGCWAGPSVYGHNVSNPTISPFNRASIYKNMLSLPEQYRFTNTFAKDFIALASADLLKVPFNQAVGLRKLLYLKQELKGLLPENIMRLGKSLKRITK